VIRRGSRKTFAELIRSGEIVSNILPFRYRDFIAAEKYYRGAWSLAPLNSKINHKLGVLYLMSEEVRIIKAKFL
jgi:hypothetical protein